MSNPAYSITSGWAKFHPGAYSGICPGGLKLFSLRGRAPQTLGLENPLKSIDFTGPGGAEPP